MYQIYHTQGIVLSSKNIGEANKMLTVFTREMGLIRGIVQGVRLNKSKLRFALQDFSYADVDFVRGKDIWRITSATPITSFPMARTSKDSITLISHVCSLLERLCGEGEVDERIFDDFIQALYILDTENVDSSSREALELHLVLKIIYNLGYIENSEILNKYLVNSFDKNEVVNLLKERQSIISRINKALSESQL